MGSATISNALAEMRQYRDSLMLKPLTADNKIAIADATLEIDRLEQELVTLTAKKELLKGISQQKVSPDMRQTAKEVLGNWFKDGFAASLLKQGMGKEAIIDAAPLPQQWKEQMLAAMQGGMAQAGILNSNVIDHVKVHANEQDQNSIDETMKWLQEWKKGKAKIDPIAAKVAAAQSQAKALAIEKKKLADAQKWMEINGGPKPLENAVLTQKVQTAPEPKKRRILRSA